MFLIVNFGMLAAPGIEMTHRMTGQTDIQCREVDCKVGLLVEN